MPIRHLIDCGTCTVQYKLNPKWPRVAEEELQEMEIFEIGLLKRIAWAACRVRSS